jgi:hypothetical protein
MNFIYFYPKTLSVRDFKTMGIPSPINNKSAKNELMIKEMDDITIINKADIDIITIANTKELPCLNRLITMIELFKHCF